MECSLPGSSVHGISQARVLEWVAISFSSCDLGIRPTSPSMAGEFFTAEPPGKPLSSLAQGNLLLGDKDEKSTDWPNSTIQYSICCTEYAYAVWICCTELIDSILIITCVAETNTDPIFFF